MIISFKNIKVLVKSKDIKNDIFKKDKMLIYLSHPINIKSIKIDNRSVFEFWR